MESSQSPRKVFPKAVVLHSRVFMSQSDEGSTLFVSFIMLHTLFPSFVSVDGISAFVSRDMILRTPLTTADRGDARGLSPSPRFSPSEPHQRSRPGSTCSSEGGHSSTSKHVFKEIRWNCWDVSRKAETFYTIKFDKKICEAARISTIISVLPLCPLTCLPPDVLCFTSSFFVLY